VSAVRRALAWLLRCRHPLTVIHPGESDSEVGDDTLTMLSSGDLGKLIAKWDEEQKRRG
jgi:hypothetical protein